MPPWYGNANMANLQKTGECDPFLNYPMTLMNDIALIVNGGTGGPLYFLRYPLRKDHGLHEVIVNRNKKYESQKMVQDLRRSKARR